MRCEIASVEPRRSGRRPDWPLYQGMGLGLGALLPDALPELDPLDPLPLDPLDPCAAAGLAQAATIASAASDATSPFGTRLR